MNKPTLFWSCLFSGLVVGSIAGSIIVLFVPYLTLDNNKIIYLGWDKKTSITPEDWTKNASKVTIIRSGAFENNTVLENIYIPDTIETIGSNSFLGTTKLSTISIPKKFDKKIENNLYPYGFTQEQWDAITFR